MRNSAVLIPEMLAEGIRFLIYAGELSFLTSTPQVVDRVSSGNADYMCNL